MPLDDEHIFITPYMGMSLLATTDTKFDDAPDAACVTKQDIDALLAKANRALPDAKLTRKDVVYAYVGLRPLVTDMDDRPDTTYGLSRGSEIYDHAKQGGVHGMISALGGKWTTARRLADPVLVPFLLILVVFGWIHDTKLAAFFGLAQIPRCERPHVKVISCPNAPRDRACTPSDLEGQEIRHFRRHGSPKVLPMALRAIPDAQPHVRRRRAPPPPRSRPFPGASSRRSRPARSSATRTATPSPPSRRRRRRECPWSNAA